MTRDCQKCDGTGRLGDYLVGPEECAHEVPCPDCDGTGKVLIRCRVCDHPAAGYNGDGTAVCQACARREGEFIYTAEELAVIKATADFDRAAQAVTT